MPRILWLLGRGKTGQETSYRHLTTLYILGNSPAENIIGINANYLSKGMKSNASFYQKSTTM